MNSKNRYRAKLILVPLLIAGSIYTGITLSQFESQAENISFTGVHFFLIIAILPPAVLSWYYWAMIKERRGMIKKKKDEEKKKK